MNEVVGRAIHSMGQRRDEIELMLKGMLHTFGYEPETIRLLLFHLLPPDTELWALAREINKGTNMLDYTSKLLREMDESEASE